jgi:hypothetical protein
VFARAARRLFITTPMPELQAPGMQAAVTAPEQA